MGRSRGWGKGQIDYSQKSELARKVANPFYAIASKVEKTLTAPLVIEWATEKYGKEAEALKAQFPALWKRMNKTNTISQPNTYSTYTLPFHIPAQQTEPFSLSRGDVQALMSEEQREQWLKVKELQAKGKQVNDQLTAYLNESGIESWEALMFWFNDLKTWVPEAGCQKRPRQGAPPPKDLFNLVREAALLHDAVRNSAEF